MSKQTIILASGGTGGHLFPAFALAQELTEQGHSVELHTDARGMDYSPDFDLKRTLIPSMGLFRTSRMAQIKGLAAMARGYIKARSLLKKQNANVVVGFGGYASAPSVLAAQHLGLPTLMHEQNSVFGRANRFLAKKTKAIGVSFPNTQGLAKLDQTKITEVGNPVRATLATVPTYQGPKSDRFNVLVYGGSQGARHLSEFLPFVFEKLDPAKQQTLRVHQQARPEDSDQLRQSYQNIGLDAQIQTFIQDMPLAYTEADLIICRSGASSVAEIATVGRAAIFVPLPSAVDDQQTWNAKALTDQNAAWLAPQSEFDAQSFAKLLGDLIDQPARLKETANKAKLQSHATAARKFADLVLKQLR